MLERRPIGWASPDAALRWLALACACWACSGKTKPAPKAPVKVEPAASAAPEAAPAPSSLPFAPPPPLLLRDLGLKEPAAALHDAGADVYLVSNVDGAELARDGNGFISRFSPEGVLLQLKWIDGRTGGVVLDAPKGMAIAGDKLYVADIDHVRTFDLTAGKPLGKIGIVSASFLGPIAVDPAGTVYVADTGWAAPAAARAGEQKPGEPLKRSKSDAIYALDPAGAVRVLYKGEELGQPSALSADADGVWVANLAGELYRIGKDGKKAPGMRLPSTKLSGLVRTASGKLLVASAEAAAVLVGPASGPFEALVSELQAPGAIGFDARRAKLLVPLTGENAVYVQSVSGE